jgi:hypothetical protein
MIDVGLDVPGAPAGRSLQGALIHERHLVVTHVRVERALGRPPSTAHPGGVKDIAPEV